MAPSAQLALIFDEQFAGNLADLTADWSVWLVESPDNSKFYGDSALANPAVLTFHRRSRSPSEALNDVLEAVEAAGRREGSRRPSPADQILLVGLAMPATVQAVLALWGYSPAGLDPYGVLIDRK